MGNSMTINTTEINNICSTFNSKVSSIDLGSIDVAGAFEPLTSQGILTNYVSSLKEALNSINENCTNISSILKNLADTQQGIDDAGKSGAETDYFGGSSSGGTRSGGSTYSGGGGGGSHSTSADNGNSTVTVNSGDASTSELSSIASTSALEALLSILNSSTTTITSEERASYLKELLKLKLQDSNADLSKVIDSMDPTELQAYLKNIYNGELAINDATVSVTYDILERISKETNIELKDLVTSENIDTVRDKVEAMSEEYINLFNSHNLQTDLQGIYDGSNIEGKDEDFVESVRTVVDIIAINQDTTGDQLLLESSNMDTIKTEIGKVTESLGQLRIMSTGTNEEFVSALTNIFTTTTSS
jgi:hypothetical protein